MQPQLPIEVDAASGVWSTDGLPMLYVPRHFFVNNHQAVDAAIGRENYAALLYAAGYKSAHFWCECEASTHGLAGIAVFQHYLKRLSQRGWGRFSFVRVDPASGTAEVRLDHSCFVLACPEERGRLCYMFSGWFAGAMDWVTQSTSGAAEAICEETQCSAEGHSHCVFTVRPRVTSAAI